MLELDGSGGGGQLVRTALSLSAITGTAFQMTGIRANRPEPGLRPQHRTAVTAVARACDATVEDAEVGSETLTFRPGPASGGQFEVDIGTAGSVTLLFDALLPLATVLPEPLAVTVRGGTDVAWSPPIDYHREVKLPLLRRIGVQAAIDVSRIGFYPVGGGEATLWLAPSSLSSLPLTERGSFDGVRVFSKSATSLADADVAERQAEAATRGLDGGKERRERTILERRVTAVETESPGSSVLVRADYDHTVAGFSAFGKRGKPAEAVAGDAASAFETFDAGSSAVDEHMADQLVVFLAIAGGRVTVPTVTDHVATNCDLCSAFGFDVRIEPDPTPTVVAE